MDGGMPDSRRHGFAIREKRDHAVDGQAHAHGRGARSHVRSKASKTASRSRSKASMFGCLPFGCCQGESSPSSEEVVRNVETQPAPNSQTPVMVSQITYGLVSMPMIANVLCKGLLA